MLGGAYLTIKNAPSFDMYSQGPLPLSTLNCAKISWVWYFYRLIFMCVGRQSFLRMMHDRLPVVYLQKQVVIMIYLCTIVDLFYIVFPTLTLIYIDLDIIQVGLLQSANIFKKISLPRT